MLRYVKRKANHDLLRYQAIKRREQNKAMKEEPNMVTDYGQPTCNSMDIGTQTDLTMEDITSLEEDYQHRINEQTSQKEVAKGFPSVENFQCCEKTRRFYTGISSFTVLMAIFNIVSAGISQKGISKLSKFEHFTLVLMKLRLHASNYDLAFRFGIHVSESTVSPLLGAGYTREVMQKNTDTDN